MCHRLCGDPVLAPASGIGTRDDLEKLTDWSDIDEADIPRLAILTDSFARFIGDGEDVSILTIWRGGSPIVHQIDGARCDEALDAVMDVVANNVDELKYMAPAKPTPEPPKPRPVASNDNTPPPSAAKAGKSPFKPLDLAALASKPVPARQWYIDGMIPSRNVTLLSGDGGTGKSLLALQIAVAGALGIGTLDLKPRHGKTLVLAAEDDQDEVHRRIADICTAHSAGMAGLADRLRVFPLAGENVELARPDLRSKALVPTAVYQALLDEVVAFRPALVVLDTSADLFGGDEINRNQVRQFVGMLRIVAMEFDTAVLLLSHPSVAGMQTGTGLSGSTAWNNSVRSRLYLTADKDDDDARILKGMKANYGRKGEELRLRWQDGVFVLDDGEPTAEAGLIAAGDDERFLALLSAVNRTGQRVAPTKGINYAPAILALRPDAKGTSKKTLEAAMHRLLASGLIKVVMDGPPSKQRQRLIVSAEDFAPGATPEEQ
jgi:RecA-family ATPase